MITALQKIPRHYKYQDGAIIKPQTCKRSQFPLLKVEFLMFRLPEGVTPIVDEGRGGTGKHTNGRIRPVDSPG
jgi:hypothetical protein